MSPFFSANYQMNNSAIQTNSKKLQMQGLRILRSEAYIKYAATTRDERNAADGLFSKSSVLGEIVLLEHILQCLQMTGLVQQKPFEKAGHGRAGASL